MLQNERASPSLAKVSARRRRSCQVQELASVKRTCKLTLQTAYSRGKALMAEAHQTLGSFSPPRMSETIQLSKLSLTHGEPVGKAHILFVAKAFPVAEELIHHNTLVQAQGRSARRACVLWEDSSSISMTSIKERHPLLRNQRSPSWPSWARCWASLP